ncbi:hypothetical protein P9112_008910 [Eukaryota sp. TZLM1-RC]
MPSLFNYEDPPALLCCNVCSTPPITPIMTQCGYLLCKTCNGSNCPVCETEHDSTASLPQFIQNALDSLPMKCNICNTQFLRHSLLEHLSQCEDNLSFSRSKWSVSVPDNDTITQADLDNLYERLTVYIDNALSNHKPSLPLQPLQPTDSHHSFSSPQVVYEDSEASEVDVYEEPCEPLSTLPREIDVFVSVADEKPLIKCRVNNTSSVADLKLMLAQHTGVSPQSQSLFFREVPLEDDKDLVSYDIDDDSALFMDTLVRVMVSSEGEMFSSFPLDLYSSLRIDDFKAKITEITGISECSVYSIFGRERVELRGHETIDVLAGQELPHVIVDQKSSDSRRIKVRTTTGSRQISLEVFGSDTVVNIKEMIEEFLFTPIERQLLLHNGVQLDNSITVEEVGLSEGDFVFMVLKSRPKRSRKMVKIKVVSQETDDEFAVDVSRLLTISDLKIKMFELSGIPVESQSFVKNGHRISDTADVSTFLNDCLYLVEIVPITLTIELLSGRILNMEITKGQTIGTFKEQLSTHEGIPVHYLILQDSEGNLINNDCLVDDFEGHLLFQKLVECNDF